MAFVQIAYCTSAPSLLTDLCTAKTILPIQYDLHLNELYAYGMSPKSMTLIPYTRVNKRICLFPKLQENMHLIPNMRLIMKGKSWPHPQNRDTSLVVHVHDSVYTRHVKRTRKLSVLTYVHRGIPKECELWCHDRHWFLSWWKQLM